MAVDAIVPVRVRLQRLAAVPSRIEFVPYVPPAPHAYNRCARCGGPVLLVSCAREGGCRTAEERVGEPSVSVRLWTALGCQGAGETVWAAKGHGIRTERPTREGAIAAWREKALAAERGR